MNTFRLLPVFGLLGLLMACEQELPAIKIGTPAPAFTLDRLDGPSAHFPEDYRGKVVAIRFWADWCPFCRNEMTALEPVYRQYHDQGLVILAVNVMQAPETARKFVEQLGISYEVLLDRQGEALRRYQVMGLPMTFIVDRQGVTRARIVGESTSEVFAQAIEGLL
ncbi:MAG TPA: TlpA disulfide reductase family protein [Candidatus Competibacteraceae bacterium]|nr:TlpA disulfide reductase family protein [Candidatus Competibacteraceae bacterium]HQA25519.1 TlpA disulfide reductase family protein [Candidatus Competibacteraceae bacterium]HQD55598.1 TlpA disulfide reductase family protein [Candidatus Competibacteraceae bacterium]